MEQLVAVVECMPFGDRLRLLGRMLPGAFRVVEAIIDALVWDVCSLFDLTSIESAFCRNEYIYLRTRLFARARSMYNVRWLPARRSIHLRVAAGLLPELRALDAPHLREVHIKPSIVPITCGRWTLPRTVRVVHGTADALVALGGLDVVHTLTIVRLECRSASRELAKKLSEPDALRELRQLHCNDRTMADHLDFDALPELECLTLDCQNPPEQTLRAECVRVSAATEQRQRAVRIGAMATKVRLRDVSHVESLPDGCVDVEFTGWLPGASDALQRSRARRLVLSLTMPEDVVRIPSCVGPGVTELLLDVAPLGPGPATATFTAAMADTVFANAPRLPCIQVARVNAEPHPRVRQILTVARFEFPPLQYLWV